MAIKPVRYRLYIDESGDHSYTRMSAPPERYLALLGVWFVLEDDYTSFVDGLQGLKRLVFGPRPDLPPVILHRKDIVQRKGAFGVLREPDKLSRFNAELLALITNSNFHVACVVIDKRSHLLRYESPFHPYHYCLAALMDRYSGWLNYKNAKGDVLAESRGREEDNQLGEAYVRVYRSGTLMFDEKHHQRALTSKDIKFGQKVENIAGLQLADVLAHPVKQAMLVERGILGCQESSFGKEVVKAATRKFNRNMATGKVEGYGKIWL